MPRIALFETKILYTSFLKGPIKQGLIGESNDGITQIKTNNSVIRYFIEMTSSSPLEIPVLIVPFCASTLYQENYKRNHSGTVYQMEDILHSSYAGAV